MDSVRSKPHIGFFLSPPIIPILLTDELVDGSRTTTQPPRISTAQALGAMSQADPTAIIAALGKSTIESLRLNWSRESLSKESRAYAFDSQCVREWVQLVGKRVLPSTQQSQDQLNAVQPANSDDPKPRSKVQEASEWVEALKGIFFRSGRSQSQSEKVPATTTAGGKKGGKSGGKARSAKGAQPQQSQSSSAPSPVAGGDTRSAEEIAKDLLQWMKTSPEAPESVTIFSHLKFDDLVEAALSLALSTSTSTTPSQKQLDPSSKLSGSLLGSLQRDKQSLVLNKSQFPLLQAISCSPQSIQLKPSQLDLEIKSLNESLDRQIKLQNASIQTESQPKWDLSRTTLEKLLSLHLEWCSLWNTELPSRVDAFVKEHQAELETFDQVWGTIVDGAKKGGKGGAGGKKGSGTEEQSVEDVDTVFRKWCENLNQVTRAFQKEVFDTTLEKLERFLDAFDALTRETRSLSNSKTRLQSTPKSTQDLRVCYQNARKKLSHATSVIFLAQTDQLHATYMSESTSTVRGRLERVANRDFKKRIKDIENDLHKHILRASTIVNLLNGRATVAEAQDLSSAQAGSVASILGSSLSLDDNTTIETPEEVMAALSASLMSSVLELAASEELSILTKRCKIFLTTTETKSADGPEGTEAIRRLIQKQDALRRTCIESTFAGIVDLSRMMAALFVKEGNRILHEEESLRKERKLLGGTSAPETAPRKNGGKNGVIEDAQKLPSVERPSSGVSKKKKKGKKKKEAGDVGAGESENSPTTKRIDDDFNQDDEDGYESPPEVVARPTPVSVDVASTAVGKNVTAAAATSPRTLYPEMQAPTSHQQPQQPQQQQQQQQAPQSSESQPPDYVAPPGFPSGSTIPAFDQPFSATNLPSPLTNPVLLLQQQLRFQLDINKQQADEIVALRGVNATLQATIRELQIQVERLSAAMAAAAQNAANPAVNGTVADSMGDNTQGSRGGGMMRNAGGQGQSQRERARSGSNFKGFGMKGRGGRGNYQQGHQRFAAVRCGNCGDMGHESRKCEAPCRYCDQKGHLSDQCSTLA
ncbi:hypothetical protein HK102_006140 [Quaeritorhiza haematococci]|nr:hypothetical protein HK102_006140 [Quaeritorhiza haematococci]